MSVAKKRMLRWMCGKTLQDKIEMKPSCNGRDSIDIRYDERKSSTLKYKKGGCLQENQIKKDNNQ